MSRFLLLVCAAWFAAGCGDDDAPLDVLDAASRPDVVSIDASPAPIDAAVPPRLDACVPRARACDGLDDDCDGLADEADEAAQACDFTGGSAVCGAAGCELASCAPGLASCDGDPANGCETSTTTVDDCGACGAPCRRPNAEVSCASGGCEIAACLPGFDDCDGSAANGCETRLDRLDACGACGVTCDPANGVGLCDDGVCVIASCQLGHGECDGNPATGCETPLTSVLNCGGCGEACGVAHGQPVCAAGSCAIGTCDAEWRDCDGDLQTGCERSINLEAHCGACDAACAGDELCRQGTCVDERSPILGLGGGHGCFVDRDGRAWCWGLNNVGQLGNGQATGVDAIFQVPAPTTTLTDAVAIDLGYVHSCAIRAGGRVSCFGGNSFGQLGNGSVLDAVSIAVGQEHTCAVRKSGKVACWGSNAVGFLGIGNTSPGSSTAPLDVVGLADAVQIDANRNSTCALRQTGTVECWGHNTDGQVGVPPVLSGNADVRGTPVGVIGVSGAVEIAMGGTQGCARLADGKVRCWGRGTWGSRGDGSTASDTRTADVLGLSDARQLAAGLGHTCAVRADGTLVCWGLNDYGQLGDGTRENRAVPTPVPGLTEVVQVAAYYFTTCARVRSGQVYCWGANDSGEIANQPVTTVCDPYHYEDCVVSLVPFPVPGLPPP